MVESQYKRNTAYKLRIGQILSGKVVMENEKLKSLDLNNKQVVRANIIANVTDKYLQEGEKKFGSITLDDGSGQIKVKTFGDDVEKFTPLQQGDTILLVGLLRTWNNEVYLTPEIIKKKDPSYLLLRKLEVEADMPKTIEKTQLTAMKDKILAMVKDAESSGGVDIDKIILELKEHPKLSIKR